jgi:hypothetical protein
LVFSSVFSGPPFFGFLSLSPPSSFNKKLCN